MTEAHKAQVVGGTSEDERSGGVLWWLYSFIMSEAAAILQIVDDGTSATYDGAAFGTPGAASFFQSADAYFVVEPVAAGETWQAKIYYDGSSTDDLEIELSDTGAWQSSDGTFGAAKTSGSERWNDGAAPLASATLYMSAGDLDGYTYLRCAIYESGFDQNMFYAGGYVALAAADTAPAVLLVRQAEIANLATANSWGHSTGAQGRTPYEYGGSTTDWSTSAAHVDSVRAATYSARGKTRSSVFALFPVFIFSTDGFCHGYFGEYTMYAVDATKADLDVDDDGTYIVCNDLAFRWNP